MKASHFAELAEKGLLPKHFQELYGNSPEKFFINVPDLKAKFADAFKEIPWGGCRIVHVSGENQDRPPTFNGRSQKMEAQTFK